MAFSICSESYEKTIVGGFPQHSYVRTYSGETGTNLITTCQDPSLPAMGSAISIEGSVYFLVSKRARRQDDKGARGWSYVDCIYDNDAGRFGRDQNGQPTQEPANIAPYVQVQWSEFVTEVAEAKYLRCEDDLGNSMTNPPWMAKKLDTKCGITNSALAPAPLAQKRRHSKIITYWTYHRTWNPTWETYLESPINSAAFTITQRDQDGIRLQYSIAAGHARLSDIIKEDNWLGNKLYFRRGLVIDVNPATWEHRVPDVGYAGVIAEFQFDWRKQTHPIITAADIDKERKESLARGFVFHFEETFLDLEGERLTEPTNLNGYGGPWWGRRPGHGIGDERPGYVLFYQVDEESAWPAALGVS